MSSTEIYSVDAFWNTNKELPSIMTAFDGKPLPPIKDSKDQPLLYALNMDEDQTNTESTGKGFQKIKRETSKNSLFSLFSRPKVEKLRGYAEPGMSLAPIQESSSRAQSRLQSPEPRLRKQSTNRSYASRPGTAMSFRNRDRSESSSHGRGSSGSEAARPSLRRRTSWVPPPLFQAYAQSIKVSKAQTIDGAGSSQVSRLRHDSHEAINKTHRSGSMNSIQYSGLPKKIFLLTPSGHLLQYTDQGFTERLPERVLQLTSESLAFVCDLVSGEPYVLQIAQSSNVKDAGPSSSASILSRMGLRGSNARKETPNLYMVFQSATEMDSWLVTIRKQIETMDAETCPLDSEDDESEERKQHTEKLERIEKVEKEKREEPFRQNIFRIPRRRISAIEMIPPEEATVSPHKQTVPADDVKIPSGNGPRSRKSTAASASDSTLAPKQVSSPARPRIDTLVEDKASSSSSHSITPRDSPMSSNDVSSDPVRKQFPFKLRSSVIETTNLTSSPLHPPRTAFASAPTSSYSSPMQTPRNTQVFDLAFKIPAASKSDERPESVVADLPSLWSSRALSRANAPSSTPAQSAEITAGIQARQNDPKLRPLRTAEPSQPRHQNTKPFTLPLRVNVAVTTSEPAGNGHAPLQDESPMTASPASPASENDTSTPMVINRNPTTSHHPRRSASVKLSLFPTAMPAPAPVPRRPITPKEHSLRRPASLQVNTNPTPPFLSSVRAPSGTRPTLTKAPSTPSLRNVSASASTRRTSSSYKFTNSPADLAGNAFIASRSISPLPGLSATPALPPPSSFRPNSRDRNQDMTALPIPRSRSKAGAWSDIDSPGLPALDLGIPVIGLAPPAPPPNRGLPSLPKPPTVPPKVAAH